MRKKMSKCEAEIRLVVAVRIRPMSNDEISLGCKEIVSVIEDNVVCVLDPLDNEDDILRANRSREKTFVFDQCFGPTASQESVYKGTTVELVQSVLQGYNSTVFAYGPTGAGKTFTMLGTDNDPGIMVLTLNDLYQQIESSNDMKYTVKMSYLEIYNEMIRDLLNPGFGFLELREDSKGVQVAGLSEYEALTTREVMSMLTRGNKERMCEPTAVNKTSSRSHAILQVTVEQTSSIRNTVDEIKVGKLFMIDLAGSERASQTQNRGKRLIEGAHINRSLLALGNCINALTDKKGASYVNYRDSKLTRLLKDSLGGNCKTVMIAHVSPASYNFEETRNTLTYADRAKNIKLKAKSNSYNVNYHVAQYQNIISELRQEIIKLKAQLVEVGIEKNQDAPVRSAQVMGRLKQELDLIFQDQIALRKELIDLEDSYIQYTLDYERHLLTIDDWQHETKCRVARETNRRRSTKNMFIAPKFSEPEHVNLAKKELNNILQIQEEITERKAQLIERLDKCRQEKNLLEETIAMKVPNEQQREILRQQCKLHELQIKNIEVESVSLMKEFLVHQKDIVLKRDQKRQKLVKEIVQMQKKLITDSNIQYPYDLDDLYKLYQEQTKKDNAMSTTLSIDAKKLSSSHVPALPIISTERKDSKTSLTSRKASWSNSVYENGSPNNFNRTFDTSDKSLNVPNSSKSSPRGHTNQSQKKNLNRHDTFVYKNDGSVLQDDSSVYSDSTQSLKMIDKNGLTTRDNDMSSLCSLQTVGISYDRSKEDIIERKRSASAGMIKEKRPMISKTDRKKRMVSTINNDKKSWNNQFNKSHLKDKITQPITLSYVQNNGTPRNRSLTYEGSPLYATLRHTNNNNTNRGILQNNAMNTLNKNFFGRKDAKVLHQPLNKTKPLRWSNANLDDEYGESNSTLSISGTSFNPKPTQPGMPRR